MQWDLKQTKEKPTTRQSKEIKSKQQELWIILVYLTEYMNTTTTGWAKSGSKPEVGEIFRTHADRLWGPPSLLYNGYRLSFLWVKRLECDVKHSPTSRAKVKERVELYFYSLSEPSLPVLRWKLICVSGSLVDEDNDVHKEINWQIQNKVRAVLCYRHTSIHESLILRQNLFKIRSDIRTSTRQDELCQCILKETYELKFMGQSKEKTNGEKG